MIVFYIALISLLYDLCRKREINNESYKKHATENQERSLKVNLCYLTK